MVERKVQYASQEALNSLAVLENSERSQLCVKLGSSCELLLCKGQDVSTGCLMTPSHDVIAFSSKGRVAALPRRFIEHYDSIAGEVETSRRKLQRLVDFIYKYHNSLAVFDKKTSRKKVNKKEQEKLNQSREALVQELIEEFKAGLCEELIRPPDAVGALLENRRRLLSELMFDWNEAAISLPGAFCFDLLEREFASYDNCGRKVKGHSQNGLSYTGLNLDSALQFCHSDGPKIDSGVDLRSVKSVSVDPPKPEELLELFRKFLPYVNPATTRTEVFAFGKGLCRKFYNEADVLKLKASLATKPNFTSGQRPVTQEYVVNDFAFTQRPLLGQKQELTDPVALKEKIDVLDVKSIEYPKGKDFWILRCILSYATQITPEEFAKGTEDHKNWLEQYQKLSRVLGNPELRAASAEVKSLNRKVKLAYYLNLQPKAKAITFEAITRGYKTKPLEVLEKQPSLCERVPQSQVLHPIIYKNSINELQQTALIRKATLEHKANETAQSRSRPTMFQTRSTMKYTMHPVIANYFDTLSGKEYLIENPTAVKPIILTGNDQILIAELVDRASVSNLHFTKDTQKASQCQTAEQSASMHDPHRDKKSGDAHELTKGQETAGSLFKQTTQNPKPSTNSSKVLVDTQHIFNNLPITGSDQRTQEYHMKKTMAYNVYGEARQKLPPVKSLYKQPTTILRSTLPAPDSKARLGGYNPAYNISHSMMDPSQASVSMDKRASSIHQARNNAPHKALLASLDKRHAKIAKEPNAPRLKRASKEAPPDLIIFPDVVDFGRVAPESIFETKFSIVNNSATLQRVIVKPPLYCPSISIVKQEGPIASGLSKIVTVILDTRSFRKGAFSHEINVASETSSYKIKVCGRVCGDSMLEAQEADDRENEVFTHLRESPGPSYHYKVNEMKDHAMLFSKVNGAGVDERRQHLPKIFYDENYKVFSKAHDGSPKAKRGRPVIK